LKPPRATGERFFHRALAHLSAAGITDVVLDEAQDVLLDNAQELFVSCSAIGTRLWLLVHEPVPTPLRSWAVDAAGGR